jgi:tRNA A-37 threonylcarbamoyl transferase component Bud32
MGTVYLCEHAVLHRRFAVKVLRADHAADAELVDRFRNEAIAASRIGQENVVDVVDFGADEDGALYYVMEALEGRSLGAVICDEGPLPVSRVLDVLEQVCRALAAAHARGVVHRDVKPDNVFLVRRPDGSERAKVIDFGISRVPGRGERITRAGAIIGTPEYMAPEQASGAPVDHRADVYAAGVLAFEMLTGALPLEAPTPHATIAAHRTLPPDPPSRRVVGIPPEVDALVLRALAKRPEDRFATMDDLAAEVVRIRAVLSAGNLERTASPGDAAAPGGRNGASPGSRPRGATVSLPGAAPGVRPARPLRRAAAALAIALGVLVAVAAGWAWRAASEARAPSPSPAPLPIATATPTPTAPPSPTPATPVATASPTPRPAATPAATPAAIPSPAKTPIRARTAPVRAPALVTEPFGGDLKDPYADDAKADDARTKDPAR